MHHLLLYCIQISLNLFSEKVKSCLYICSPSLLGMLWEVTDADIDKMTANFMSNWIPSTSERPWTEVDINSWSSGTLSKYYYMENSSSLFIFLNTFDEFFVIKFYRIHKDHSKE